jgi:hypothetical protein
MVLLLTACAAPLLAAPSFARPHPAVVRVSVVEREGMSLGSGALVAADQRLGLVVTCWHVVQDAAGPIVVSFPDGFRSAATVVRTDREWDLAALAIHRPPAQPIAISAQAPRPDEILVLAGYGGNGDYRAMAGRCTQYLAPEKSWPMELVELDAPARQGDSGGPIFNSRGELAGVLSGSGFGQTCGSYCGRVRWFLGVADADFRRVSSEEMLAQQRRNAAAAGPLAAAPALPAAPAVVGPPAIAGGEGGAALGGATPGLSAVAASPPAAAPTASVAAKPARTIPTVSLPRDAFPPAEQVKTILALIGIVAVIYHGLRLLGRAVG